MGCQDKVQVARETEELVVLLLLLLVVGSSADRIACVSRHTEDGRFKHQDSLIKV